MISILGKSNPPEALGPQIRSWLEEQGYDQTAFMLDEEWYCLNSLGFYYTISNEEAANLPKVLPPVFLMNHLQDVSA